MRRILSGDEWTIVQECFDDENSLFSESIFSLANGYMGGRGNFEEGYGGKTLRSFFHAGVYYPDKAQYGWYKIGYPLKNNKVINSPDIIGIKIKINGSKLDLFKNSFKNFKRILNMKNGLLKRSFIFIDKDGMQSDIIVKRFLSMHNKNLLAISYSIVPIDRSAIVEFEPYIDGNVTNSDSGEKTDCFWKEVYKDEESLVVKTKSTDFHIASTMRVKISLDNKPLNSEYISVKKGKYIGQKYIINLPKRTALKIEKFVSSFNSRNIEKNEILKLSKSDIANNSKYDFDYLLLASEKKWKKIWKKIDIKIDGDVYSQQAIRFNLFMLNSTYTGEDKSLNISPKGFTGEMYNGSTYWDTEIYCLPYFLYLDSQIAKNLLLYRFNFLPQAINNAKLLGLKGALYPMITLDGNEGHAEWEITLMEIHRNSAMAFAIYNYIIATGDTNYMVDFGFEVIANIARFWADRVIYNSENKVYTILGVTGPDEFHNNVDNNWYTNLMAKWVLNYAYKQSAWLKNKNEEKFNEICKKYNFKKEEFKKWQEISEKIFLNRKGDIFVQFDGFFEKEQLTIYDVPHDQLPVVQHWSWDRINRVSLIKQADVILGLYLLSDHFTLNEKKENFIFYELRTLHESSLSPSIYSILASHIGLYDKAFELFKKSALYDLEDINNNTEHGLHITSMGGTCLSILEGFIGLKVKDDKIQISPYLPPEWKLLKVRVIFRERLLSISISKKEISITLLKGDDMDIFIYSNKFNVNKEKCLKCRRIIYNSKN
ncbi:MAG: family 65 glycosyl hydrolase domain-containing protein [Actinobacteria bacterium]|nr:family 65 glycosyl hydrolase domain-containing protein [Cyanobacteriota bacterium]MCL5771033.1 family 65 glycosyl hydrolase domain-containing protein [Actinomycetota bacterium]